ncbi:hypothetical protein Ancab_037284 [Ancistrocladus abbreviatus]
MHAGWMQGGLPNHGGSKAGNHKGTQHGEPRGERLFRSLAAFPGIAHRGPRQGGEIELPVPINHREEYGRGSQGAGLPADCSKAQGGNPRQLEAGRSGGDRTER